MALEMVLVNTHTHLVVLRGTGVTWIWDKCSRPKLTTGVPLREPGVRLTLLSCLEGTLKRS